ncbi:hypothetical protein EYF80_039984 [Liparis tanakae]|uniref:Uncharacterized protein n=1 Tax=Liparis tanakae TaxID=230148 RepID=A0A4Z2G9E6_9TELE|nr:hypothetical protein EYF80_039984 [Liparis tanakae]
MRPQPPRDWNEPFSDHDAPVATSPPRKRCSGSRQIRARRAKATRSKAPVAGDGWTARPGESPPPVVDVVVVSIPTVKIRPFDSLFQRAGISSGPYLEPVMESGSVVQGSRAGLSVALSLGGGGVCVQVNRD